jgi:branched-chain amino acid transport system ATP-binding protein
VASMLEVSGLRVGYGDLTVIWEADLTLTPGRTTALLGRNGAGKTTLVSGIAGLQPARAGTVVLDGRDVTRMRPWERATLGLGVVQEGKRILRSLTVVENLVVGLPAGVRGKAVDEVLEEAFTRFPVLRDRRMAVAGSLSGGQQQMLALANAMVGRPKVLLIDEPSSGLAPVVVDEVLNAVDQLKRDGIAVLLVEQLVEEVLAGYADDVVVIDQGRVVLADEVANVTVDDVVRGVYTA